MHLSTLPLDSCMLLSLLCNSLSIVRMFDFKIKKKKKSYRHLATLGKYPSKSLLIKKFNFTVGEP